MNIGLFLGVFNLGFILLLGYKLRQTFMNWRLGLRREEILALGFQEMAQILSSGDASFEDALRSANRTAIRLGDEIANQLRHDDEWWLKVPRMGDPWPDFQPANVVFIDDEEEK